MRQEWCPTVLSREEFRRGDVMWDDESENLELDLITECAVRKTFRRARTTYLSPNMLCFFALTSKLARWPLWTSFSRRKASL
jgi:hypothetical protein